MGLPNINFKNSYYNQTDNIVDDFLIPSLKESIEYDRAVGFFSSTSIASVTVGIKNIVEKNGRIKIICSPQLSEEDLEAIKKGYEMRDVIEQSILRNFIDAEDDFYKERLNIVSHLITSGIMDIKIAYMNSAKPGALFHPKIGVIKDENENFVSFTGSMNDSANAFFDNEESIDVYTSFGSDYIRALEKKRYFDDLWANDRSNVTVIEFPESAISKINKYRKETVNYSIDEAEIAYRKTNSIELPKLPKDFKIRDYQKEAYINWKENNFIGIYDMATGTGKTYSALYSVVNILNEHSYKLGVIICCPYQHLVNQWSKDLDYFGFKYISGFSGSPQKNWKKNFKKSLFNYNHGFSEYFCFITTNSTFSTAFVQENLSAINKDMLLVVDEAHNFGTYKLSKLLDDRFKYRLALSATLERHNDSLGTGYLYNYFQKKCITYSLEKAIESGMLVPYYYYPEKAYLSYDEYQEYNHLSEEVQKYIRIKEDGSIEVTKKAEMLLIKRARLVAGAISKLDVLSKIAKNYINSNHILVYCGSSTVYDYDFKENVINEDEIRQVDAVSKTLSELGIVSSQFTSRENAKTRELLKSEFDSGTVIQALVAIRCLDEGVNIPSVDKAIILASSTNPKEYIQRRGRVLRNYPGKDFAIIHDIITLPRDLDNEDIKNDFGHDLSLIKREVKRLKDFAKLSLNEYDSDKLITEIENVYGYIEEGETYE